MNFKKFLFFAGVVILISYMYRKSKGSIVSAPKTSLPLGNSLAANIKSLTTPVSNDSTHQELRTLILGESKYYSDILMQDLTKVVSTYAQMRTLAVGNRSIDFLVLNDENKSMEKTSYKYFPTGQLIWYASQIE